MLPKNPYDAFYNFNYATRRVDNYEEIVPSILPSFDCDLCAVLDA